MPDSGREDPLDEIFEVFHRTGVIDRADLTWIIDMAKQNNENVTFTGGWMHVDGRRQLAERVEVFESSNGLSQYTAILWRDQRTNARRASCNCPGWTFKRSANQPRGCKHTYAIETGNYNKVTRLTSRPIAAGDADREVAAAAPSLNRGARRIITRKES